MGGGPGKGGGEGGEEGLMEGGEETLWGGSPSGEVEGEEALVGR